MNFSFVFMSLICDFAFQSPRPAPDKKHSPGNKKVVGAVYYQMEPSLSATEPPVAFEQIVLPHLDAAYNLARWLAGNDHDAEDIAQEACVRAWQFFGGYRGGSSRAWLLTIVRNTASTWLKKNRPQAVQILSDDELAEIEDPAGPAVAFQNADVVMLRAALAELPLEFREALVLRELEGFSYKEIADVADVPMGTVMSRLARARRQLQTVFRQKGEVPK
jgi:RNA polymerase sigma-70 factor (ECF subfamily)